MSRALRELHTAWEPPADGPALVNATLELGEQRTLGLAGAWPATITGDRATVEIGGRAIEGELAPGWRRLSCARVPLELSVGGVEVRIPAGGYVELIGREGDRARIAAPVAALSSPTLLIDAATIGDDACAPSADTAPTDQTVVNNGQLCMTGRPEERVDGALVRVSSSAPVRVLERDGEWVRARARMSEAEVTGWLRSADLDADERPGPPSTRVELTAALRIGALEVPAGTHAWRVERECDSCEGPPERLEVTLREGQRRAFLRVPASDAAMRPSSDEEASEDRRRAGNGCLAPGATETSRGSLSRESIRRTIRSNLNAVRLCYEARLNHRPELEGRLLTSFIVGGGGRVVSVVTHGDMDDAFVRRCVERAMRTWRFPPPEGGGVVGVNYPFVLTSQP